MDNNQTMQWQLIFRGVQEAIRDMKILREELDKFKDKKITGSISDQLKRELELAKNITNQEGQKINEVLGNIGKNSGTGITRYVDGYKQAISSMMQDIEKYNRLFQETGDISYQQKLQALIPQVRQLQAEHEKLNATLGLNAKNVNLLGSAYERIKSHASWLISGGLLMGAIAIPSEAVKTMADVEQQMAGMLQTLPQLYKDYPNHIKDQEALNRLTMDFIGIGQQYGQKVDEIIEAGKLWSRGYKDINTVLALTHNTSKLAIADMLDLKTANTGVEAVISAYHQQANAVNFSNHIVDAYTNIAHNAQSSATDLAEALKRSAAAANQVGVSFDFATAMASVMIKDTGQSGSIVGNALKAIFSNIHSDKGIKELEKLGVAVYEFDESGTKHFRNVENVFTDLMIKMSGSSKNMEETMKKISGGSFQWGRASALFSDYNEFIRVYNLSLNSSGVAEKQVMAQMDTLVRKAEQVKAALTGIVMGTSEAGLSSYLKSWLDSILNVLKGLQQINPTVYTVMGTMAKWGITLYAAKTALDFLDRSIIACTTAKAAFTTSTEANTAAQAANVVATNAETGAVTRLGIATTAATGGLNLILAALVAAGIGATLYAANIGEATTALEQQQQKQQDLLSVKQQELDMNAKQTEFIGTLANSYVQLQQKLQDVGNDETKAIEIKKSMGVTTEELTKLIGEEGVTRLQQSNWSQEAIRAEQDTHSKATVSIKSEIEEIKTAMDIFTDKQIDAAQTRIDSLYKETEALSIWRRAQLAAYDMYAGIMDKQIKIKTAIFNNMPDFMQGEKTQLGASIDEDRAYLADFSAHARDGLKDDIDQAKAELARLKIQKYQRDYGSGIPSSSSNYGGSEVDEDDGKKKRGRKSGNGPANPPPDHEQETFRLDIGRDTEHMLQQAKIAADQYSQSLELLNSKESILGFSTDNANEKLKLMNARIVDLIGQSMEYTDIANGYDQQVNDMVASNETLKKTLDEQKVSWSDLTKEEKQNLIQLNRQDIQNEKTITKLMSLSDKLRVKAQEATKEANHIGIETVKLSIDTPEKKYNKNMSDIELDKQIETAKLGYDATEEQKKLVEAKYRIMELTEATRRLKEIEDTPPVSDTPEGRQKKLDDLKKQQLAVEQLKLKLAELNNYKLDKIKTEFADMITDWAVEGKSFGDIWKSIWKDFEKDAIYALMGIKREGGFLTQVLTGGTNSGGLLGFLGGLFGGKNTAKKSHDGENIITNAPKMHDGGVVGSKTLKDDEVLRTLQVGERVLSKDANESFNKIMPFFKNQELFAEMKKGSPVVPVLRNPELAKQVSTMNSQFQQFQAHIERLDKNNELIMQQNQMLLHLINDGQGGGNTNVVVAGASAEQILKVLDQNPDALWNILNRHKSFGYR